MKIILIFALLAACSACTNRQSYTKSSVDKKHSNSFIDRYRGRNIEVIYIHDDSEKKNKSE